METWKDIFVKTAVMHLPEPWTLQEDDTLQADNLKPGWKKFVQHRALGRFQCSQCFHEWSSAKVHILFHMHRYTGWGMVWMRVFRQACSRCPDPRLEEPKFSQETMERVMHNLVLKILKYYYCVSVQPSDLLEVVVDVPVGRPHDSTHCEGCQVGICSESSPAPSSDAWKSVMDVDEVRTDDTHHTQQTHHKKPALDAWEPVMDVDEVRTDDTHHTQQTHHKKPALDAWEPVMDVDKIRTYNTHHTHQTHQKRPALDAWEPVVDVGKVRTNYTHYTDQTHHTSPAVTSTCCSLPFDCCCLWERCCPWECCCCTGSPLVCTLVVIFFILYYFTKWI